MSVLRKILEVTPYTTTQKAEADIGPNEGF